MIKEQVVSALSALGFIPEEIEDFGYRFDYEGLTLIYSVHRMFSTLLMTTAQSFWKQCQSYAAR